MVNLKIWKDQTTTAWIDWLILTVKVTIRQDIKYTTPSIKYSNHRSLAWKLLVLTFCLKDIQRLEDMYLPPWETHTLIQNMEHPEFIAVVPSVSQENENEGLRTLFKLKVLSNNQSPTLSVSLISAWQVQANWRKIFETSGKCDCELFMWCDGINVVFWSPYFTELHMEVFRVKMILCEGSVLKFCNRRKEKAINGA